MTLWLGDIVSINATTARNKHSLGIHGLDSTYLHTGINHGFSYVERRRILRASLASFFIARRLIHSTSGLIKWGLNKIRRNGAFSLDKNRTS